MSTAPRASAVRLRTCLIRVRRGGRKAGGGETPLYQAESLPVSPLVWHLQLLALCSVGDSRISDD